MSDVLFITITINLGGRAGTAVGRGCGGAGSSHRSIRVIDGDVEVRLSRRNYAEFDGRLVKGRAGAARTR